MQTGGGVLEVLHEDRKSKLFIRDIKYSPDGETLAIASEDGKVYLHDAKDYALRGMCQKTPFNVLSFDYSSDSATLQLTTSADELLFYNARDGTPIASNASVRDVDWATITCPLGWHVQGVWQTQSSRPGAGGGVRSRPRRATRGQARPGRRTFMASDSRFRLNPRRDRKSARTPATRLRPLLLLLPTTPSAPRPSTTRSRRPNARRRRLPRRCHRRARSTSTKGASLSSESASSNSHVLTASCRAQIGRASCRERV